jgi:bacillolysin
MKKNVFPTAVLSVLLGSAILTSGWAAQPLEKKQILGNGTILNNDKGELKGLRKLTLVDLRNQKMAASASSSTKALRVDGVSAVVALVNSLFANASSQVKVERVQTDPLGYRHIRLMQYYNGHPVKGSDMVVHLDPDKNIIGVSGSIADLLQVPSVTLIDQSKAEQIARALCDSDDGIRSTKLVVYNAKLCYEIVVGDRSKRNEPADWCTIIDAETGAVYSRRNQIVNEGPSTNGLPADVTGNRVVNEDGSLVTIQGWRNTGGNYYLYNGNRQWGIINDKKGDWEQRETSSWGTSDPAVISLGNNFTLIQEYTKNVLGKSSYDDNGAFAVVKAHVGTKMVNASWQPVEHEFCFGDGDDSISASFVTLDIAAHEFCHAITSHTSNLEYWAESGALNESFSDILGTLVEFYYQPDGRSAYPSKIAGTADWLVGEDCWLINTSMRNMREPEKCGHPSYYFGDKWFLYGEDQAGVHTNSGVQNFVFYLLAEGGTVSRYGKTFTINKLGIQNAGKIAMYANMYSLTGTSQYIDSRNEWINAAARYEFDTDAVKTAWEAAGVYDKPWFVILQNTVYMMKMIGDDEPKIAKIPLKNRGELSSVYSLISSLPSWLSINKTSGNIGADQYDTLIVTYNSGSLPVGSYSTKLKFSTNTPEPFNAIFPDSVDVQLYIPEPVDNSKQLTITPKTVTFGTISSIAKETRQFTVSNPTSAPITILSITTGGTDLYACGSNQSGSLGTNDLLDRIALTSIGLSDIVQVSAEAYFVAALSKDGGVWTWGGNMFGQLGDGTSDSRAFPVKIIPSGVKKVLTAHSNTYFLFDDGSVSVCGFGAGKTPKNIFTGAIDIAAGGGNVCMLKSDGSVWAWGSNDFGELGSELYINHTVPFCLITGGVNNVYGAYYGYFFVMSNGDLLSMGHNYAARLADGSETDKCYPGMSLINDVVEVYPGVNMYARRKDNSIWGWSWGPLGDGSTSIINVTPTLMPFTGVARIDGSAMLSTNGSLYGWGANYNGELPNAPCVTSQDKPEECMATSPVLTDAGPIGSFSFEDRHLFVQKASKAQSFSASPATVTIPAGGTATINVSMSSPEPGSFTNIINLQTDSRQTPWITVVATGTVHPANVAPTANAGVDQRVAINTSTILDGSGSKDFDNYPASLGYSWTKIAGPTVSFSGDKTDRLTFTPGVAGTYIFRLTVSDGEASAFDDVTISVNNGITLPGRIQAEEYKSGGEGVGYHDLTVGNTGGAYLLDNVDISITTDIGGGYNVGWIQAGEWLAYDVFVPQAGKYNFTARMASGTAGTKSMLVSIDGATVAVFNFTDASGWQNWKNVTVSNVNLTAGSHVAKITMTTGSFNLNYLDVTVPSNLITNGEFSNGTTAWNKYYYTPGAGDFVVENVSNNPAGRMTITNAGNAVWQAQLYQTVSLTAGKNYTLDFDIRIEGGNKQFTVYCEENGLDYTSYFSQAKTITLGANTWQHFTVSWTQSETKISKIGWKLGTYNVNDVWFDNVFLKVQ